MGEGDKIPLPGLADASFPTIDIARASSQTTLEFFLGGDLEL